MHEFAQGSNYGGERCEKLFKKDVQPVYEKRWRQMLIFLRRVFPLLVILRPTFNVHRYGDAEEAGEGKFDKLKFAEFLASNFWFAYMKMLLKKVYCKKTKKRGTKQERQKKGLLL